MNIQTFSFANQSLQIIIKDNQAWFIASEVANLLGYLKASDLTRILDDDEKGTHNMRTLGGNQDVSIINESGFYHAAFKSRKAEVKPFRKWVTSEVLPQIRKTGTYSGSPKPIPNKTTSLDREPLRNAVNLLVSKKGLNYSEAYTLVHQRFNVAHLDELDSEQIPQAVEYVHRVLCGEVLDRLPEKTSTLHLTEQDLRSLSCVIRFMPYLLAYYHLTEDAVRSLNRRLCGTVHDRFQDSYLHACHLTRSLNIEQQDWRKAVQEIQLHANLI
ncbi:BRO-N domain-containing protein [Wielerella bovis]|uniref:BRO-N domain-containing protein n=1 Tax=Wielerella bovis TaxID=2917790 RepID=UPI00201A20B7|nr:BRO family protein [Wielerella bovis]ULJ60789.1 hypothetical protein MIS44_02705 [Wielerella bovis]